jgi:hypothetical protein
MVEKRPGQNVKMFWLRRHMPDMDPDPQLCFQQTGIWYRATAALLHIFRIHNGLKVDYDPEIKLNADLDS